LFFITLFPKIIFADELQLATYREQYLTVFDEKEIQTVRGYLDPFEQAIDLADKKNHIVRLGEVSFPFVTTETWFSELDELPAVKRQKVLLHSNVRFQLTRDFIDSTYDVYSEGRIYGWNKISKNENKMSAIIANSEEENKFFQTLWRSSNWFARSPEYEFSIYDTLHIRMDVGAVLEFKHPQPSRLGELEKWFLNTEEDASEIILNNPRDVLTYLLRVTSNPGIRDSYIKAYDSSYTVFPKVRYAEDRVNNGARLALPSKLKLVRSAGQKVSKPVTFELGDGSVQDDHGWFASNGFRKLWVKDALTFCERTQKRELESVLKQNYPLMKLLMLEQRFLNKEQMPLHIRIAMDLPVEEKSPMPKPHVELEIAGALRIPTVYYTYAVDAGGCKIVKAAEFTEVLTKLLKSSRLR
jgi:hypothetical protein